MPRAATTSDVYNAIAEPRRREILELLCEAERAVGDLVADIGIDQPSVSKHLRVLREVELVNVRKDGRHRLYSANVQSLRPVREWLGRFERIWDHQLARIKQTAEAPPSRRHKARKIERNP